MSRPGRKRTSPTPGHRQDAGCFDVVHDRVDDADRHAFRTVAGQAQHHRSVSRVPLAGGPERSHEVDDEASYPGQCGVRVVAGRLPGQGFGQAGGEVASRAHGADRVRGRRANAHAEDVADRQRARGVPGGHLPGDDGGRADRRAAADGAGARRGAGFLGRRDRGRRRPDRRGCRGAEWLRYVWKRSHRSPRLPMGTIRGPTARRTAGFADDGARWDRSASRRGDSCILAAVGRRGAFARGIRPPSRPGARAG